MLDDVLDEMPLLSFETLADGDGGERPGSPDARVKVSRLGALTRVKVSRLGAFTSFSMPRMARRTPVQTDALDVVPMRPESELAVECEKLALEYPKQARLLDNPKQYKFVNYYDEERPLERLLQLGEDEVAAPS